MALLSLRTPRQNWRLMSSRGRFDFTLFWDGFISILLESNDGGDWNDDYAFRVISGAIDNASYAGDNDKASYDGDNNDKAYKIVHLGEVFRSREFKCAGKLHNLTNVDTSILRRGIDSYYLVKYYPETVRHLSSGHVSSWRGIDSYQPVEYYQKAARLSLSGQISSRGSNDSYHQRLILFSCGQRWIYWNRLVTKKQNDYYYFLFCGFTILWYIFKQTISLFGMYFPCESDSARGFALLQLGVGGTLSDSNWCLNFAKKNDSI